MCWKILSLVLTWRQQGGMLAVRLWSRSCFGSWAGVGLWLACRTSDAG